MPIVDILVIVVIVLAVIIGAQRGLLASIGSLVGLTAGGIAAFWLVPLINDWVPWTTWRGWVVLLAAVGLVVGGTAVGAAIGLALRRGVDKTRLRGLERFLGALVSFVVAVLAVSLVGQSLAATGMPVVSSAVASSQVLRTIESLTPRPIATTLAELRGAVLDEGIPRIGELLAPGFAQGVPDVELDDPALAVAAQSVARISGTAYSCGTSATGSGFVIATDLLVTNAHVVAGVDAPVVELPGRTAREGRIVYYDPVDDLAVVAVEGLDAVPLGIVPTLAAGSLAVVQGYPYGGPFTMSGARVLAVGTAPVPGVYDGQLAPREVYSLAAAVRPGNSGGPLLTPEGAVAGVVFARAEDDEDRGYAMTTTELAPILEQAAQLGAPVSSGACTE